MADASVHAGRMGDIAVVSGTAVRLMTGVPISEGADCVVSFERVEEGGETIRLSFLLGRHEKRKGLMPRGLDSRESIKPVVSAAVSRIR